MSARVTLDVDFIGETDQLAISMSAECLLEKITGEDDAVRALRRAVWPAYAQRCAATDPHLVLVPLDRIGAEQGFSGARVVLGYFTDNNVRNDRLAHASRPMVIKVATQSGGEDKLADEYRNAKAVEAYVARSEPFAIPLHLDLPDKEGGPSVLWSPFAAETLSMDPDRPEQLKLSEGTLTDLLTLLRGPTGDAAHAIDRVLELLDPMHRHGRGARVSVDVVEDYSRYLRGADDPTCDWTVAWRRAWASGSEREVVDLGRTWTNPFWVLEQLRGCNLKLVMGAIHGDLHPRNIVVAGDENSLTPHIIDFGWAQPARHVVKDFALLELNLRFVVLPPSVQDSALEQFVAWLGDAPPPSTDDPIINERARMVQLVRARAHRCLGGSGGPGWDAEYVVPLFLISLGLLRHARSFDHTSAGRLTVLSLAEYVAKTVLST